MKKELKKRIFYTALRASTLFTFIWFLLYHTAAYLQSKIFLPNIFSSPLNYLGLILVLFGIVLAIRSMGALLVLGRGTPVPWNPTRRLVVVSSYKIIRNPITVGILLLFAGTAIFINLTWVLISIFVLSISNHLAIVYWEEPKLEKKFGKAYTIYKKKVPRWIPRLR